MGKVMSEPPKEFDGLRAVFWLVSGVIAFQCFIVLLGVGSCLWYAREIIEAKAQCQGPVDTVDQRRDGRSDGLRCWLRSEGQMTKLTDNFTLAEMTATSHGPNPTTYEVEDNLQRLAEVMEKVRVILGNRPIQITSGFRSPPVNAAVGGAANSAHLTGLACDFVCPAFGTPLSICQKLKPHMEELGIDQLIHEFGSWVHLGIAEQEPRMMALTIDNGGTRHGFA
jgi:zinc D-Ala-D-Ala carboxypeptidase